MQPTPNGRPHFSIILPARNEEARIRTTLEAYLDYSTKQGQQPFEMIVVANGCTDATVEVVKDVAESHPSLRLVDLSEPGKGRAILKGFEEAEGEVMLFCDSDGSTDIADIWRLLEKVSR
jgi:glycosyltransferase involved in cell wall biosynthesis